VTIRNVLRFALLGILFAPGAESVGAQLSHRQAQSVVVITRVTVIGGADAAPQPDQTVLIHGNRISAVGKSLRE